MTNEAEAGFRELLEAMKKAGGILNEAGVPWGLGGGLAFWAREGPETEHDVDFLIRPEDAGRAQQAFAEAGLPTERPPDDLIFDPQDGPVDDDMLGRVEELEVYAMRMKVASLEDVLTQKVLALSEQRPDFSSVLELARSLREQVDWDEVRDRTRESPFAKAYLTLLDELEIVKT